MSEYKFKHSYKTPSFEELETRTMLNSTYSILKSTGLAILFIFIMLVIGFSERM